MRNKIQNSFNELPPASHESLRDSLIAHIGQITNDTDNVIVTQLCLAVTDLALLMASWKHPIDDLLEMMQSRAQSAIPLLEILKLIPEEMDSRYLRLGANRRSEIYMQMEMSTPKVIEFLCMCTHQNDNTNEKIIYSTLSCYAAWVSVHVISVHQSVQSALMQYVFCLLNERKTSRKLHDVATESLCALLSCVGRWMDPINDELDPQLKLQIFNTVYLLEQPYHTSVAMEDIDKTMNYCRIFTMLCEAFFFEMFYSENEPHYSIKGLDLVLVCVGHFDYEVAEITFHLWYRLSEELFHRNNDKLTAHFKPHIERLLGALYRLSQLEVDQDGLLDENNAFSVCILLEQNMFITLILYILFYM